MGDGRRRRLRGAEREAFARAVLERWRASGRSQREFCASEGIAPVTLIRWRREFPDVAPPQPPVPFVRVDWSGAAEPFELELAGGVRLRVPPGFREEDLARLLSVLGASRC